MKTRIGIYGYGNVARGVECAVKQSADMELVAVFTRRDPATVQILTPGVPVLPAERVGEYVEAIDVLMLCGGSATDLPVHTPQLARLFHVVDSFDTHKNIPTHFAAVDEAAKEGGKVAVISAGWDPGLFSLNRLVAGAVLSNGVDYTFWGKGISQGHSDAIRRVEGVLDARQYTIPIDSALEAVRSGETPELTTRQKHLRDCYVVAEEGADLERIREEIVTMKNYFDEYDTTVTFVTAEQLKAEHGGMPHGGFVIRSGKTGWEEEHKAVIEYRLQLDSNPEFTALALVACARACHRMAAEGQTGCKTMFDIPPAYLSPLDGAELRRLLL
ncbi:MAG: diaminopimelate dehydrogenase [Clostridia bacterium]|nr:diaminopimelate dehydrogenase [Clostridia bacterium]